MKHFNKLSKFLTDFFYKLMGKDRQKKYFADKKGLQDEKEKFHQGILKKGEAEENSYEDTEYLEYDAKNTAQDMLIRELSNNRIINKELDQQHDDIISRIKKRAIEQKLADIKIDDHDANQLLFLESLLKKKKTLDDDLNKNISSVNNNFQAQLRETPMNLHIVKLIEDNEITRFKNSLIFEDELIKQEQDILKRIKERKNKPQQSKLIKNISKNSNEYSDDRSTDDELEILSSPNDVKKIEFSGEYFEIL